MVCKSPQSIDRDLQIAKSNQSGFPFATQEIATDSNQPERTKKGTRSVPL